MFILLLPVFFLLAIFFYIVKYSSFEFDPKIVGGISVGLIAPCLWFGIYLSCKMAEFITVTWKTKEEKYESNYSVEDGFISQITETIEFPRFSKWCHYLIASLPDNKVKRSLKIMRKEGL